MEESDDDYDYSREVPISSDEEDDELLQVRLSPSARPASTPRSARAAEGLWRLSAQGHAAGGPMLRD